MWTASSHAFSVEPSEVAYVCRVEDPALSRRESKLFRVAPVSQAGFRHSEDVEPSRARHSQRPGSWSLHRGRAEANGEALTLRSLSQALRHELIIEGSFLVHLGVSRARFAR